MMQVGHNGNIGNNGCYILLVEDNKIAQRIGIAYLEDFSFQVHLAQDAEEARILATTNPYDLILLDIGLPDGDGKDVARAIRHDKAGVNQETPVVAITAHGYRDKQDCLNAGINQVYAKPMTREMIIRIMQDFNLLD